MTTPPYQPGQYGQPNQDPWGQQPGGGYGQYGQPGQPQQQPGPYGPGQGYGPATPGQGGQYGGQPEYGGTQQWPGGGYGGMAPPPPKKNKTPVIVVIVVIAALVIGGAAAAILFGKKDNGGDNATNQTTTAKTDESDVASTSDEETTTEETVDPGQAIDAQPGDCIKVNVASETDADVETVDCSTAEAIYRVASREETDSGSCQTEAYVSYTEEGQLLLCLQLNVREGDCLQVTDTDDKRVECTSPDATYKVVGVREVDDESQCGADTSDVITYPQPPLTICLADPQG